MSYEETGTVSATFFVEQIRHTKYCRKWFASIVLLAFSLKLTYFEKIRL